ncbi:unnamed protein product [Clonostachys rhizophaga]|uniref:Uncharacterized protein n=1 Tax=Clonostachys rhizophaga TaxID=160324 RepID=A0A9N9YJG7_9HYPO|nr:unnamed protein product [Clonostachys rhizophaga]
MAIPHLCNEIRLRIVEFCDMETISTLKKVPGFSHLLQTFETSIVKNIYRMSTLAALDEGHSPFVLRYDLSALEKASAGEIKAAKESGRQDYPQAKPVPVHTNTFVGVEELQRRDHDIEVLLRAPSLLIKNPHDGIPHSWPAFPNTNSRSLLQALLKRAMTRCDVLADMEGQAIFEMAGELFWFIGIPDGPQLVRGLTLSRTLKLQKEYLESLSLDSLIEVYFLGTYLAECRHQKTCVPTMDVEYFKREQAFQEAVLRHGSWAMYNEFRGSGGRAKHHGQMRDQITESMVLQPHEDPTRADVWHLDGLRTTLHHMLLLRLGGEDVRKIGGLRTEVYKRIGAMIGAPKAFENPPSLKERPDDVQNVNSEWL